MIKVIVFDFDDTLVLSEHTKQQGFVSIFSAIIGAEEIAEDFVGKHFGSPRHEMIRGILMRLKEEGIIDFEISAEIINAYLNKFSGFVDDKIINGGEAAGAAEVLDLLSKKYILYINSNTPQGAIERIVEAKNWKVFFRGIFGSPPSTKNENLIRIIDQAGVAPGEVVVIGDGESDRESARVAGASFIGIGTGNNRWRKEEKDFIVLDSLIDALKFI